ncbi:hypothetical protein [Muricoccus radiodurans]|uniref:hypothetical protein n=1 Tax=Muricoccus radiodurans TaxID=2231721 RepID=UPI003CF2E05F
MSSIRAHAIEGRVVVVHDMTDRVVISEFEADQAANLLEQLQRALGQVLRGLSERAAAPPLPDALA